MKVSTKGRVTIPAQIRRLLQIEAGSEVDFVLEGDSARLILAKPSRQGSRMVGRLRGKATTKMTTDQILELTRGDA